MPYTPVADLMNKRAEEERFRKLVEPRKLPQELQYGRRGDDVVTQKQRLRDASIFNKREDERLSGIKNTILQSDLNAKQAALGAQSRLSEIGAQNKQQRALERIRASNNLGLEGARAGNQMSLELLRQSGKPGKKLPNTGLTAKQRADIESSLYSQYYDKGKGGKALRKRYEPSGGGLFGGERTDPGGFKSYLTEQMARYGGDQQQGTGLPNLPQGPGNQQIEAYKDPATGVWHGGQVAPQQQGPVGADVENYVSGAAGSPGVTATPGLPALQQQNNRISSAFAPPPSLASFSASRAAERESTIADAFRQPPPSQSLPTNPFTEKRKALMRNIKAARRGNY